METNYRTYSFEDWARFQARDRPSGPIASRWGSCAAIPGIEIPFLYPPEVTDMRHPAIVLEVTGQGARVRVPGYFGARLEVRVPLSQVSHFEPDREAGAPFLDTYKRGTVVSLARDVRTQSWVEHRRRTGPITSVDAPQVNLDRVFRWWSGPFDTNEGDPVMRVLQGASNHSKSKRYQDVALLPNFRHLLHATKGERQRDEGRTTRNIAAAIGEWLVAVYQKEFKVEPPKKRDQTAFEELQDRAQAPYGFYVLQEPQRYAFATLLVDCLKDYLGYLEHCEDHGFKAKAEAAKRLIRPLYASYAIGFVA